MIELPFNSNEFIDAWNDWQDYKQVEFNFKYKSPQSLKAAFKKLYRLSKGDEETAIAIIEESMANGWRGFFALKEEKDFAKKEKVSAAQKLREKYGISNIQ